MKFFHIITVSEANLKKGLKNRDSLEGAIGAAVVNTCWGPAEEPHLIGGDFVDYREAIGREGMIRYVGEFGDRDLAFFACAEGRLVPVEELDDWRLEQGIRTLEIHRRFKFAEDADHPQT